MAHSLSHIIPRVGPHMSHINWFGKGTQSIVTFLPEYVAVAILMYFDPGFKSVG